MVENALDEAWPATLERGVAGAAIEGEERSGDLAVFAGYDGGALVAVVDGLGHGDAAADASAIASETIRRHRGEAPEALLRRCHAALRKTRGAVMTLAWFDLERHRLAWAGVGNVEARLVRGAAVYGDRHDSALVLGGVVGYNLPTRAHDHRGAGGRRRGRVRHGRDRGRLLGLAGARASPPSAWPS